MQKTVKFNIFKENLQDVVWGNKPYQKASSDNKGIGKSDLNTDRPIPKPVPEFWKNPLSYSGNK